MADELSLAAPRGESTRRFVSSLGVIALTCTLWAYRIIYRIDESTVNVFAVLDGRRELEDLLLERLTRDS